MNAVYRLTLRQLAGRWRFAIMAVLATLPVLITIMGMDDTAATLVGFEKTVLGGMLAGTIAPLIVLAIGTVAFGNEVEDKTLANLMLSPIARWKIALPKLLGVFTVAAPFIVGSALVVSYFAYLGDVRAMVAVTAGLMIAVALYSSLFTWLGLVTSQAIGVGLLYIVLWEGFLSRYIAGVRYLSIRYYAVVLMHAIDDRTFAGQNLVSTTLAGGTSVVVLGGFLWLTIRRLRRMDVP